MRKAHEAIGTVLAAIGQDEETGNDDEKATGTPEAKRETGEEPPGAKHGDPREELTATPSVRLIAARAHIYALRG